MFILNDAYWYHVLIFRRTHLLVLLELPPDWKNIHQLQPRRPLNQGHNSLIQHSERLFHFAYATKSTKLFLGKADITLLRDERFAMSGAKLNREEEKNASKRKAVSVELPDSDSE